MENSKCFVVFLNESFPKLHFNCYISYAAKLCRLDYVQLEDDIGSGVYILSQNFIIAPKRDKHVMKNFIIAANLHVARNEIY